MDYTISITHNWLINLYFEKKAGALVNALAKTSGRC